MIAVVLWRGDQIFRDRFLIGRYQHVLVNSSTNLTQTELLTGLELALQAFGFDTNLWAVPTNLDLPKTNMPRSGVPFSVSVLIGNRVSGQKIYGRIESNGHSNLVEYTLNHSK